MRWAWSLCLVTACTFPDVLIGEGGGAGIGGGGGSDGGGNGANGGALGGGGLGTGGGCFDADRDGRSGPPCGTDCDDDDPDVFPDQPRWFDKPRSNGSFDYDCNDKEDQQYFAFACNNPLTCKSYPNVYISEANVACGDEVTVGSCTALTCSPSGSTDVVRCH